MVEADLCLHWLRVNPLQTARRVLCASGDLSHCFCAGVASVLLQVAIARNNRRARRRLFVRAQNQLMSAAGRNSRLAINKRQTLRQVVCALKTAAVYYRLSWLWQFVCCLM